MQYKPSFSRQSFGDVQRDTEQCLVRLAEGCDKGGDQYENCDLITGTRSRSPSVISNGVIGGKPGHGCCHEEA